MCYLKNPKKKSHPKNHRKKSHPNKKNQETHAMFQAKGVPQGKDLSVFRGFAKGGRTREKQWDRPTAERRVRIAGLIKGKRNGYPPKFNIAPENRESQKETHLPTIHFQGLC